MPREPLVRLECVSRHYDTLKALDQVDLRIQPGEWLAVMGPSGSGKSTLLNLLGALDRPTSGHLWIDGAELTAMSESDRVRFRREKVGIIFQQFHLFTHLTAVENVMIAQHYHSVADAPEALAALARVGLSDRASHLPGRCQSCRFLPVCNGNLRTRAEFATGDWLGQDPSCYLRDAEIIEAG